MKQNVTVFNLLTESGTKKNYKNEIGTEQNHTKRNKKVGTV